MKRILIAGLGNVLRGDDGFGIRVLREMSRVELPRGVDLYEAGGAGIALVQKLMDGYDACIIVDAARKNGTPGTLYRLVPEAATDRELGTHDLDPGKILALARAMGALPAEVLLIGCEPQETEELCEELSSAVAAVVGQAVQAVLKELARLCG